MTHLEMMKAILTDLQSREEGGGDNGSIEFQVSEWDDDCGFTVHIRQHDQTMFFDFNSAGEIENVCLDSRDEPDNPWIDELELA